jgi:hypothetical protein
MVFLGVTMDIAAKLLSLSSEKCIAYGECISALISGRWDRDSVVALRELKWWQYMLQSDFALRGVPLAHRATFPELVDEGVIAPYSDASREQTSPADSGYGAWAIVGNTFAYVKGRWSLEEVRELDINSLELAAMNIGSFTIMAYAKARGFNVSHLYAFTGNTAAEHSAERGKPKSSRLGALIEQRYSALHRMQRYSSLLRDSRAGHISR